MIERSTANFSVGSAGMRVCDGGKSGKMWLLLCRNVYRKKGVNGLELQTGSYTG